MKKALLLFFCVFVFSVSLQAQGPVVRTTTMTASTLTGPVWDLTGTGVTQHLFTWSKLGTVSAGACKLQQSVERTFASPTDLIAAETVTSSGGPTALTTANANFVRVLCSTALVGSGSVIVTYAGIVRGAAITVQPVISDAAEGAAVATTPVPVGCVYRASPGTLDTGDVGYIYCDPNGRIGLVGSLSNNGAAAATNRVGVLPAIAQSNLPSAQTAGRDTAVRTDLYGTQFTSNFPLNGVTTYAAAGSSTLASTPTDIFILPGNATNTVIVTSVTLSCTQTTAAINDVLLVKRSTANSGGTSSAITAVPLDSGNAAAVSAPLQYTANPTTGSLVGAVDRQKIGFLAPATASANDIYIWKPSAGQSIVLRGVAQGLAINLAGQTTTGAICVGTFGWIETTGL